MFPRHPTEFPAPDEFYDWACARLGLPEGTFLSRRFSHFEEWGKIPFWNDWPKGSVSLPNLWRNYPLSAAGLRNSTTELHAPDELDRVEEWLLCELEEFGRKWLLIRGASYYFKQAEKLGHVFSAHEQLETILRWEERGYLAPRDEKQWARFEIARQTRPLIFPGGDFRELTEFLREENLFVGADLRGANFRNLDLSGVNFQGANLRGVDFEAANLSSANFDGANFKQTDLRKALLTGANYVNAQGLSQPGEVAIDWDGTGLRYKRPIYEGNNHFHFLDLHGRCFRGVDFGWVDFLGCDFSECDLSCSVLQRPMPRRGVIGCRFTGANLRLANWRMAPFHKCDFSGADCFLAALPADLEATWAKKIKNGDTVSWGDKPPVRKNFAGIDCRNAPFYGRNFANCDFSGADFTGADLRETNFLGANLTGAKLSWLQKRQIKQAL